MADPIINVLAEWLVRNGYFGAGGVTAVNAKGGGGGGGSGAITTLIMPAIFLPDVLKVAAGAGGRGGTGDASGIAGTASWISLGTGITAGTAIPNVTCFKITD